MHSLNFLVVELETARTKLLDVFEEANGGTDNDFNRPSGTGASLDRYPGTSCLALQFGHFQRFLTAPD